MKEVTITLNPSTSLIFDPKKAEWRVASQDSLQKQEMQLRELEKEAREKEQERGQYQQTMKLTMNNMKKLEEEYNEISNGK